jgi:chemotaxis methyl-accepting protein methylase
MLSAGSGSLADYLHLLRGKDGEAERLAQRITIKVSRFYRNRPTFDTLRTVVIPGLAAARRGSRLRVWSAGCACGEEAYTLAMLMDEAGAPGVVDASDVDESALSAARAAVYARESAADLPAELRERYLEPITIAKGDAWRVSVRVTSRVRFVRHDLTREAPIREGARFDLVCCRNVLIYLQPRQQDGVCRLLREAVSEGGFLCLGEAEWPPPAIAASLEPLGRTRVFRATAASRSRGTS